MSKTAEIKKPEIRYCKGCGLMHDTSKSTAACQGRVRLKVTLADIILADIIRGEIK